MSGVIVDTCIWSLALRGKTSRDREVTDELTSLIKENRAKIIGLIRQEILSGYSDLARYEKLRNKLRAFPNEQVIDIDYESAAEYSNICRRKGVQGSHTDFLICAVASRLKMPIYTSDKDFSYYSQHLPISLFRGN
ncbi:MAG: PIN domain-containing protein [Xenococcaceae cyanobacterium MO_234.B1]|nr:PIN domain-containing protein [Xenococcaceae cyanobacterium MO_234.B1]